MRRLFTLLAGLCIVLAPNSAAALGPGAHSNKAPQRLSGKIQDSLGRPVAGADLSLQAASGKILAHARSDAQGRFSFDNVPAGTYAVTASKSDFKPAIKIAVVAPGKPAELTLAMQSQQALSLTVVAKSLDVARNSLSPQTGGSVYHFSR